MTKLPVNQILNKLITPFLSLYIYLLASLIGFGVLLDFNKSLDNQFIWQLFWVLLLIIALWKALIYKANLKVINLLFSGFKEWFGIASLGEKTLVITTLVITAFNLLCSITLYPFNWDSMTYHLTRVMYFIQHQNTDFFDANFWTQITYPIYGSYLNIAFLMLFGDERGMNLVQYISGIFASLSVVGISLLISGRLIASFLSGCIFLNLTVVNLQMTTTQVDLLMASLLGCSIYFLIWWIRDRKIHFAFFASLSFAISLGVKGSGFLYVPALLVVLITFLFMSHSIKKIYHLFLVFILCVFVFFTSGYYQNLVIFGNATGPEIVLKAHSFKGLPLSRILKLGLENTVRFSSQFISLDGLPPVGPFSGLHKGMQKLFIYPFQMVGIDVYNDEAVRVPFIIDRPQAHEDLSFWGILGILVLLSVFLSFFTKKFSAFLPLSLGAVFFFLTQSFAGQYDPWRGRFFIACAIFAVPACTIIWQLKKKNRIFSLILSLLLIVSSFSSVTTLVLRKQRPLVDIHYGDINWQSVFSMDRIEQLTANRRNLTEPLRKINAWLDQHPDLKLYTILPGNFYEYPLFKGNEVIPLNGFVSGFQENKLNSIEKGLLLYDSNIYKSKIEDIEFGENLFGRVIEN